MEPGVAPVAVLMDVGDVAPLDMAFSRAAATPLAGGAPPASMDSPGVVGCDMYALPSAESKSTSSGGRRSFSISDFRLIMRVSEESTMGSKMC